MVTDETKRGPGRPHKAASARQDVLVRVHVTHGEAAEIGAAATAAGVPVSRYAREATLARARRAVRRRAAVSRGEG